MKKRSFISVFLAVLMIFSIASTMAEASGVSKTGKYWQGPIQFYKNNSVVQIQNQPIILNNTAYLPVRDMAQVLGMNVQWFEATGNAPRRIMITDSQSTVATNTAYYTQLVSSQQAEIKSLKEKVEALEKEKKDLDAKLDDANKKLDKYKRYDDRYDRYDDRYNSSDIRKLEDNLNKYEFRKTIERDDLEFSYYVDQGSSSRPSTLFVRMTVKYNKANIDLSRSSDFLNFLEKNVMGEIKNTVRYGDTGRDRYYDYDSVDFEVKDEYNNINYRFEADYDGYIRVR